MLIRSKEDHAFESRPHKVPRRSNLYLYNKTETPNISSNPTDESKFLKKIFSLQVLDINVTDSDGVSALRFAAQYGHFEITEFLLDRGN